MKQSLSRWPIVTPPRVDTLGAFRGGETLSAYAVQVRCVHVVGVQAEAGGRGYEMNADLG